jgi:hypothetical protein
MDIASSGKDSSGSLRRVSSGASSAALEVDWVVSRLSACVSFWLLNGSKAVSCV